MLIKRVEYRDCSEGYACVGARVLGRCLVWIARLRFGGGGCARIGFDWFQCVLQQLLIEDGDFMPL